jgi:uncharacterized protein
VISAALSRVLRVVIRFYQRFLNPLLKALAGPASGCRFLPTCSNYFLQAVEIHGPYRGSWLGFRRILRCHPWGKWGVDPVPQKPQKTRENSLLDPDHCSCKHSSHEQ